MEISNVFYETKELMISKVILRKAAEMIMYIYERIIKRCIEELVNKTINAKRIPHDGNIVNKLDRTLEQT